MDFNQIIKNWHAKASGEDYFSKFVFEYLAFIAYLRTHKYPLLDNDRKALQKLKQDNELKRKYLANLNSIEKKSWGILISEFQISARLRNTSSLDVVEDLKWWNHVCDSDNFCCNSGCGNLPNGYTEFNNDMKGIIFGEKDWPNMIEFWRAVRDNLFHGSKDPKRERNQLLVEHGYKTLRPLVEIFLSDEG